MHGGWAHGGGLGVEGAVGGWHVAREGEKTCEERHGPASISLCFISCQAVNSLRRLSPKEAMGEHASI